MILNSLLNSMSEFNRLFSTNEFQQNDENDEDNNELIKQNEESATKQIINDENSFTTKPIKFKNHADILNNSNKLRTSTPRANKIKTRQTSDEDPPLIEVSPPSSKQPISDDSLVIALSQYESTAVKNNVETKKITAPPPIPPPKKHPVVKKFNFNANKNTDNLNEKSFTRFKSDPLNNNTASLNRNRCNSTSSTNNNNLYPSSSLNDDDDDDDDVNLLFNDQNLLKIIDSKTSSSNNNHLNDTFNRNLIVKKVPSLSHLHSSNTNNKVIQVSTNKCNLKMPRMNSSDQVVTNSSSAANKIPNKNFYGSTSNKTTQSTTTTVKYTDEQIEFKRQQALLRLKQNKK